MATLLKALAYGAGGIAVVGMATLVAFQERLVYVPVLPGLARAYAVTPSRFQLDYEDIWIRSSDGVRLHAWFLKHSPPVSGSRVSDTLFFPILGMLNSLKEADFKLNIIMSI
ncbi:hypothetical protein AXF42_Ash021545 [Apostasia shenzhenica]|uniref:Uncharacterized protein n=1 Tax=Apostasia shenzhenica TaxID=1088818 RepID=A0A2H9ZYD0_9ASPA|nr:hypothetical protein AXF42_Ash021545 [Apostasia shenzhenica]